MSGFFIGLALEPRVGVARHLVTSAPRPSTCSPPKSKRARSRCRRGSRRIEPLAQLGNRVLLGPRLPELSGDDPRDGNRDHGRSGDRRIRIPRRLRSAAGPKPVDRPNMDMDRGREDRSRTDRQDRSRTDRQDRPRTDNRLDTAPARRHRPRSGRALAPAQRQARRPRWPRQARGPAFDYAATVRYSCSNLLELVAAPPAPGCCRSGSRSGRSDKAPEKNVGPDHPERKQRRPAAISWQWCAARAMSRSDGGLCAAIGFGAKKSPAGEGGPSTGKTEPCAISYDQLCSPIRPPAVPALARTFQVRQSRSDRWWIVPSGSTSAPFCADILVQISTWERRGTIAEESILLWKIWRPLPGAAMAETVTNKSDTQIRISQLQISQTCNQPTALRHDCLKAPVPPPAPEAGQLCSQLTARRRNVPRNVHQIFRSGDWCGWPSPRRYSPAQEVRSKGRGLSLSAHGCESAVRAPEFSWRVP